VFVLTFALVGGGVYVVRQALKAPSPAEASMGAMPKPPPLPVEKLMEEAKAAASQREYGRSEAILLKAVESYPDDARAHLQLAQVMVTQKKFKEAYPEYEAAIATSPKGSGASAVGDPKLHFEAGTVADEAGLVERAEEHYSMAQTGDPTEPRYPLYLAMVQIKLGKDGPALASLIRATKLNPELAAGWGTLAELALKENQLDLALQHVDKARHLEPEMGRWRVVEARIRKRRAGEGDIEQALQLLLSLDRAERAKPDVLRALGECYGLLKRPADAAYMYAEACRVRPDDADAAYQAALWYQRAGNEAEAVKYGKMAEEMRKKGK
jgi:tetratricopeptide (TPR) repeat protein